MRGKAAVCLMAVLMFIMEGCGQGKEERRTQDIRIAAAASLRPVYEEKLIPLFQKENPDITVRGVYDSSGRLQAQIEEGLEADIFMPAARKQMDLLNKEGLIQRDTLIPLLENNIVLIVPAKSREKFERFEDVRRAGTIVIGDPDLVPAGSYAKEVLENLGIWEEISAKASFGTNVTEVLNQVAEGSADAGFVYATDARGMKNKVKVMAEAPEGMLSEPVIYPVAMIKESEHEEAAKRFLEFLQTKEALCAFEAYGFVRNTAEKE